MTVIEVLEDMLAERRFGDPEKSYVSKLHHKGLDHILKRWVRNQLRSSWLQKMRRARKIMEMYPRGSRSLVPHLVLLSHLEEPPSAVLAELEKRLGVGGLLEKANRADNHD